MADGIRLRSTPIRTKPGIYQELSLCRATAVFAVSASALWVVSVLATLCRVSAFTAAGLFCAVEATLSRILVKKEIQSKMRVIAAGYGLIINYNRIDGVHGGDNGIYVKIGAEATSGRYKMLLPCIPDL